MSKKVSQMPSITSLADADLIMVVDDTDGANKRITKANALAGVGSPSADLGPLLWRLDPTDTSQFEAPKYFERNSGVMSGSAALSIVDLSPDVLGRVLRITTSGGFQGGATFKAAGLALPSRYVVVTRYAQTGGNFLNGGPMLCYRDSAPLEGIGFTKSLNTSSYGAYLLRNNRAEGLVQLNSGGTFDALAFAQNGFLNKCWVNRRINGDTPSYMQLSAMDMCGDGGMNYDGITPHTAVAIGAGWDGVDMPDFGVGVFATSADTSFDIAALAVYAHPDDTTP